MDINHLEGEIFQRMRENHRRLIRKAERTAAIIDGGVDDDHVVDLHRMLVKSATRREFVARDLAYFFRLRDMLLTRGRGMIFVARNQRGAAAAAVLCARFGRSCYYLYGGFDFNERHLNLNQALHWTAIQWAKSAGCTEYNMLGAGTKYPPSQQNAGFSLYNFKKGFGADLRYYAGYFDLTDTPRAYGAFRLVEKHGTRPLYVLLRATSKLLHVKP